MRALKNFLFSKWSGYLIHFRNKKNSLVKYTPQVSIFIFFFENCMVISLIVIKLYNIIHNISLTK